MSRKRERHAVCGVYEEARWILDSGVDAKCNSKSENLCVPCDQRKSVWTADEYSRDQ